MIKKVRGRKGRTCLYAQCWEVNLSIHSSFEHTLIWASGQPHISFAGPPG